MNSKNSNKDKYLVIVLFLFFNIFVILAVNSLIKILVDNNWERRLTQERDSLGREYIEVEQELNELMISE